MTYTANIYKIICSHCEQLYVGSTKNRKGLSNRMFNHRADCNKGKTSKFLNHMREHGFDKFTIHLLEIVEVADTDEQRMKEQEKIEILDTILNGLNTRNAYQTREVRKAQNKVSYQQQITKRAPNYKENYSKYRAAYRTKACVQSCDFCEYETNRPDSLLRHRRSKQHKTAYKAEFLRVFGEEIKDEDITEYY